MVIDYSVTHVSQAEASQWQLLANLVVREAVDMKASAEKAAPVAEAILGTR